LILDLFSFFDSRIYISWVQEKLFNCIAITNIKSDLFR